MKNQNSVLSELSPQLVFKYFEEICNIPRCSYDEKRISDYLVQFAIEFNLEYEQDENLNVLIKKAATVGYENSPIVILQGHMDMVCVKEADVIHDFKNEPLKLQIIEGYITAKGTSLGADNGIAVAYCLALLASNDIKHPPLEIIITSKEEVGLIGATEMKLKDIKGKILINMDSEEEGELLSSCAGGVRYRIKLPLTYTERKENSKLYCIRVEGLKGGHSGTDIDKHRGNANKIIGRILQDLDNKMQFNLLDISGGQKMNAIPSESEATILIDDKEQQELYDIIASLNKELKSEYSKYDKNIKISIDSDNMDIKKVISDKDKGLIISAILLNSNGIQTMNAEIDGLVESSTNLGVIKIDSEKFVLEGAVRSSIEPLKEKIVNKHKKLAKRINATIELDGDYPGWGYQENSYIRDLFVSIYREMYNKEAKITAVHAGLECGVLNKILGDLDMISFGPDMFDVHSPNEKLSISSSQRMWEYLINILKEIK